MGREDFSEQWIRRIVRSSRATARPEDWVFAAVDDVAERIGATIAKLAHWGPAVLAGGGVKNPVLLERIRFHADDYCADNHADDANGGSSAAATILLSDELGIPCEAREAMGFAVLGALSQDGVPITLPQVTGAKDPGVAGVWAGI